MWLLLRGRVSGYDHPLYADALRGWDMRRFTRHSQVVGEITHIAEANRPICDDDVVPNEPVYSDEQLVAELRRVGDLQAVGALTIGDFASRSTVSVDTLRRRFGGWRQALAAAGLEHRYSGRRVTPKMRGAWVGKPD